MPWYIDKQKISWEEYEAAQRLKDKGEWPHDVPFPEFDLDHRENHKKIEEDLLKRFSKQSI